MEHPMYLRINYFPVSISFLLQRKTFSIINMGWYLRTSPVTLRILPTPPKKEFVYLSDDFWRKRNSDIPQYYSDFFTANLIGRRICSTVNATSPARVVTRLVRSE